MTERELQSVKQRFGIIGNSPKLNHALEIALQVAPTDLSVLLQGESGTGKEIFAQVIHYNSPRKHNTYIAVNCGAIPEGTIDSELFGHEKGAFTGAHESRKGYFEVANHGTIFLDEIAELPLGTQARLLRVLETGEFIRVGSSKVQKTDVRVIAATNANLLEAIQRGTFREDLYYRLNVLHIHIPPLRERKSDISLLAEHFLNKFIANTDNREDLAFSREAMEVLLYYDWPGNVRELENVIERAVILADTIISPEHFPQKLYGQDQNRRLNDVLGTYSLKKGKKILEKRLIERVLDITNGNKSNAVKLLEISYPSLLSKIKEYGLSQKKS